MWLIRIHIATHKTEILRVFQDLKDERNTETVRKNPDSGICTWM